MAFRIFCLIATHLLISSSSSLSELPSSLHHFKWNHAKPCYVEKCKVSELLTTINETVHTLNQKDHKYSTCSQKLQVTEINFGNVETCSEDRITGIRDDLIDFTGRLLQLTTPAEKPSDDEFFKLTKNVTELVSNLQALRVYYGPSPCDETSVILFPFSIYADHLESVFSSMLAKFLTSSSASELENPTTTVFQQTTSTPVPESTTASTPPTTLTTSMPPIGTKTSNATSTASTKPRPNVGPTAPTSPTSASTSTTPLPNPPIPATTSTPPKPAVLKPGPPRSIPNLRPLPPSSPSTLSFTLPQLVSQLYSGNASNIDAVLSFIERQPTSENQIIGFSTLHDQIRLHSPLPTVSQWISLAQNVHRISTSTPTAEPLSYTAQSKLTQLIHDLTPITLIGERAECTLTNVAYHRNLTTADTGETMSTYLFEDQFHSAEWAIHPNIATGILTFTIRTGYCYKYPLYASDTNPNTRDVVYKTRPSQRYALRLHQNEEMPSDAERDWALVPVKNQANEFRILTAGSKDVLFAHRTAMGSNDFSGLRRVLLAKSRYKYPDFAPKADRWKLTCRPATYAEDCDRFSNK